MTKTFDELVDEYQEPVGQAPSGFDAAVDNYGSETAPVGGLRKSRSALGEIATGIRSGVTEGVPLQVGQAMQWAGEPVGGGIRQGVYDTGKSIADAAKVRQELPENKLQPTQHNVVTNALAEGGQMLAPSIVPPLAVGAGLAALGTVAPALAVGGGAALGISSVLGAAPAAMQQGQETYERVKAAGASDEAARTAGWKNLAIEGAGEAAGTYVGGKFLDVAGTAFKKAVAPSVGATIKGATDPAIVKPFLKGLGITAGTEVGTELGQAGSQALVEKNAGVDVDPLSQMAEVVGPTLGMTALLSPFGLRANYKSAQRAEGIDTVLSDPTAPAELRQQVVNDLHKRAVANNAPDADEWLKGASADVAAGLPVRREPNPAPPAPTVDPAVTKVQEDRLNKVTPDGTTVTVEGDKATVTQADGATVTAPTAEVIKDIIAEKAGVKPVEEAPPAEEIFAETDKVVQNVEEAPTNEELAAGLKLPEQETPTVQVTPPFDKQGVPTNTEQAVGVFDDLLAKQNREREAQQTTAQDTEIQGMETVQPAADLTEQPPLSDVPGEAGEAGEAVAGTPAAEVGGERAVYEELRAGKPEFAGVAFEDLPPATLEGIKNIVDAKAATKGAVFVGRNAAGEELYDQTDGMRYSIPAEQRDKPEYYRKFGGDLVPADGSQATPTPQQVSTVGAEEQSAAPPASFSDHYHNDRIDDAATDLLQSKNTKEIKAKLDSIFGTIEEAERAEEGDGSDYTVMHDIALDRRADLEHAARNRYEEETRDILEAIRAEQRQLEGIGRQTERPGDVLPATEVPDASAPTGVTSQKGRVERPASPTTIRVKPDTKVTVKVQTADGKVIPLTYTGDEITTRLKEIDDDVEIYEQLKKCVGGK